MRDNLTRDLTAQDCCVLNSGGGAWAFAPLALQLSAALGVDISSEPRRFNYLLNSEEDVSAIATRMFVPLESIRVASDKRLLATVFKEHHVPIPETWLFDDLDEVRRFISAHPESDWCLKYPTGCGAGGHRLISKSDAEPPNWPRPFVVQQFIRLERPEVYRTYCAGGEMFGWVARRFPAGAAVSPWVAHARGARYVRLDNPPAGALAAAQGALRATGLWDSFGCVDLLRTSAGEWLVLEVGTDGLFNHVDRDLDDPELEQELNRRIAAAFWKAGNNT